MMLSTDFEKISEYEKESAARRIVSAIEVVREHPRSELIRIQCASWDGCEYQGTAMRYYGYNTHYRCPECGEDSMVVVG